MKVLGIAVDAGKSTVRLALADAAEKSNQIYETFEVPFTASDLPTALADLHKAISSKLSSLAVTRVLVRRADPPARASFPRQGTSTRLLVEGVVVAAARAKVPATFLLTGAESAGRFGSSKDQLRHEAEGVAHALSLPKYWTDTIAAALAACAD